MTRRVILFAFALPWVLAIGSMALERLDNLGKPGHPGLGSPPAWLILALVALVLALVARSALGRVLIAGIVALGLTTVVFGWKMLGWFLPHLADFRFGLEPAKVLRRFRYAMQRGALAAHVCFALGSDPGGPSGRHGGAREAASQPSLALPLGGRSGSAVGTQADRQGRGPSAGQAGRAGPGHPRHPRACGVHRDADGGGGADVGAVAGERQTLLSDVPLRCRSKVLTV
jgi:hypothetical protein